MVFSHEWNNKPTKTYCYCAMDILLCKQIRKIIFRQFTAQTGSYFQKLLVVLTQIENVCIERVLLCSRYLPQIRNLPTENLRYTIYLEIDRSCPKCPQKTWRLLHLLFCSMENSMFCVTECTPCSRTVFSLLYACNHAHCYIVLLIDLRTLWLFMSKWSFRKFLLAEFRPILTSI